MSRRSTITALVLTALCLTLTAVTAGLGWYRAALPLGVLTVLGGLATMADLVLEEIGRRVYPGDGRYTGVER